MRCAVLSIPGSPDLRRADSVSSTSVSREPTVGEISRRLQKPLHRIEYVIRSRRIRPSGIAGNCRVFAEADVERIAAALRDIDARKEGGA